MKAPRVSIVIPAYNSAATIAQAVTCATGQTIDDLEVVVVDDGSTDDTARIVEELALGDARIRLLKHEQNKGRLEARRTGITAASGDFTLQLDADDELLPDMAERMLSLQNERYDIVQCDFELRYLNYVSPEDRRFTENFVKPPTLTAHGHDVTHVVFRDRRTTWSLCGKLMRTSLLKRALAEIPASSLTQAEDACIYFIVSSLASSYRGTASYKGYIYNVDLGHSDARWKKMDLDQFAYTCRYADAMNAIRAYLERAGLFGTLGEDYRVVRHEHVRAVADKLIRYVEPACKEQAFDMMVGMWEPEEAIAGMADANWDNSAGCLEAVAGAQTLKCEPHEVKTVAALHYRMQVGGAERVAADLVRLWCDQGLRVVFFADEPRERCAYDLPEEVVWVELPPAAAATRDTFLLRAQAFADALRSYQVDALVHHQWWSPLMAWELLIAKTLDVPVCILQHSSYVALFVEPDKRMFDYARIARHADMIIALSQFDQTFWQRFNPRVLCTVNPSTALPDASRRSPLAGKNIVWVGRLAHFDKQPQEAIEIMARIAARDPDCTLTMVGDAPTKQEFSELKALVRQYGLEGKVEFTGTQVDPTPYYERASLHLLTSRFEGWCLTLAESKAHGLPCVMYELPNLTLTQGRRGLIAVAQGDRDAAADAVVALLADQGQRTKLGQEAFEHISEIAATDCSAFWTEAFSQLAQGSPERKGFELADAQWDLLVDGFKTSIDKALDCPAIPYAKRKGKKLVKKAWHRLRGR